MAWQVYRMDEREGRVGFISLEVNEEKGRKEGRWKQEEDNKNGTQTSRDK